MKRYSLLAVAFAFIAMMGQVQSLHATTVQVGTCLKGLTSFSTITAAIASPLSSGGTIKVCPGTYSEQLQINKELTLEGVNTGDVVIQPPLGGLLGNVHSPVYGTSAANIAVFTENSAEPVMISNIIVDGTNAGVSCSSLVFQSGIYYQESSGMVKDVEVRNELPQGICGIGIFAEDDTNAQTITVQNDAVHNFNYYGVVAVGFGTGELTASISANLVTAASVGSNNGVAGIDVAGNATATVTKNTVTNMNAFGVFLTTTSPVSVTGNTIFGSTDGVVNGASGAATITGNQISGGTTGIFLGETGNIVQSNTIFETVYAVQENCFSNTVTKNTIISSDYGIYQAVGSPSNSIFNTAFPISNCSE